MAGSSSSRQKYDVFISFRGDDTRNSFKDHLQTALIEERINVFRDERMKRGKLIWEELVNAIEASRISVILLSKNYASSTWCLDELVRIVQCGKDKRQTIIPVYYDVSYSDVKEGIFEQAFLKLEETFKGDIEKVQTWRSAMSEVTNLRGWELEHRPESEFIKDIVKVISNELHGSGSTFMNLKKVLVGVKSCWEKIVTQAEANLPRLELGPTIRNYHTALFFFNFF